MERMGAELWWRRVKSFIWELFGLQKFTEEGLRDWAYLSPSDLVSAIEHIEEPVQMHQEDFSC